MNKKLLSILLAGSLSFVSFSSFAVDKDINGVPVNKYGAVDANAKVSFSEQVPKEPQGYKPPIFSNAAEDWKGIVPNPPKLDLKAYVLMDAKTGNVIADFNPSKREAPASLVKLVLLYVVLGQLANNTIKLDTIFKVPEVAWATAGSRMFLEPGDKISVLNLLKGVIVPSGNDAAVTLAVNIAGTQQAFVQMMNYATKHIGMTNSHFSTVMGLPAPNQYSTAYDLSLLAQAVIKDYPQYYSLFGTREFVYNNVKQPNYNKLLFIDKYADGLKTGSTKAAGYSLISSEKRPDKPRLIAVVLGSSSQIASAHNAQALLKYGNFFFQTKEIYKKGTELGTVKVYGGDIDNVRVGVAEDIFLTIPNVVDISNLTVKLNIVKSIDGVVTKGQNLGDFTIFYKKGNVTKDIAVYPVVALESVKEGDFAKRTMDKVKKWWSNF